MIVVINTDDATAGSTPKRTSDKGTIVPVSPAITKLTTIAPAKINDMDISPNHIKDTTPAIMANNKPLMRPTNISRSAKRVADCVLNSCIAIARTATVTVCVPALPPIEATIGMSTASATMVSSVLSKRPITIEARTAVNRFNKSHPARP